MSAAVAVVDDDYIATAEMLLAGDWPRSMSMWMDRFMEAYERGDHALADECLDAVALAVGAWECADKLRAAA